MTIRLFLQCLIIGLVISGLVKVLKPLKRFLPNIRLVRPTVETVGLNGRALESGLEKQTDNHIHFVSLISCFQLPLSYILSLTVNSVLRFLARPSTVSFVSMGTVSA